MHISKYTQPANLEKLLLSHKNPSKAKLYSRYFKTQPGEYGHGDVFLGITVPTTRNLIKGFRQTTLEEHAKLLSSPYHEVRFASLCLLVWQYQHTPSQLLKAKIFRFYLKNLSKINNWDLVDSSAPKIVGDYLLRHRQKLSLLKKLSHSNNLWARRIAILASFAFIDQQRTEPSLELAVSLLNDPHDLIHKALGWMLREVGKRCSQATLISFLDQYSSRMPRVMLRYAIERLPKPTRQLYLNK